MNTAEDRVGWLLTLEPVGDRLVHSLYRDDGRPSLVEAKVTRDVGALAALAARVVPSTRAGGVWSGPLVHSQDEQNAAASLGLALVPEVLRDALLAPSDAVHTVSIATRGWLASIPWDALALTADGSTRLVERARVAGAVSPALVANRAVRPVEGDPAAPGLAVIDPGPPVGSEPPLFPGPYPPEILAVVRDAADLHHEEGVGMSTGELTSLLMRHPSRLFYYGHLLDAGAAAPAAAALLLSEGASADRLTARSWIAEPYRWPAPARVAIVGCAGDDAGPSEQSGLVAAAVNAGAAVTTTTRWLLPADNPTHALRATTRLATAVHQAHRAPDVLGALRAWQLEQLADWRSGGRPEHSPVLWSSLVTYLTP